MKKPGLSVAGKVLCSALSAAMVIAFAPAIGTAVGSSDALAYADAAGSGGGNSADSGTLDAADVDDSTSLEQAISKVKAEGTITLKKNVDLTSTVNINKSLNLNLNGFNIAAKDIRALHIQSGSVHITGTGTISADKTANNSTFNKDSSVIRVGDTNAASKAALSVDKNVTVSSDHCYGIGVFGSQETTLDFDGTIKVSGVNPCIAGNGASQESDGKKVSKWAATDITLGDHSVLECEKTVAVYHPQKGTLTLGSTTIKGAGGIEMKSGTMKVERGASPTIEATKPTTKHVTNNNDPSTPEGYAISIVENKNYVHGGVPAAYLSAGTYKGVVARVKDNETAGSDCSYTSGTGPTVLQVTGGTYSADPSKVSSSYSAEGATESYVVTGYRATQSGNVYKVAIDASAATSCVAEVENQDGSYSVVTELSAAFTADAKTVKLLKDVKGVNSTLSVPKGSDITLDLNGKTISGAVKAAKDNGTRTKYGLIAIATTDNSNAPNNAGTTTDTYFTVTGNGTIENIAANGTGNYAPVFSALEGANLTIDNGTYTSTGYSLLDSYKAHVVISDGTFTVNHTVLGDEGAAFYIEGSGQDGDNSSSLEFKKGTLTANKTYGIFIKNGSKVILGSSQTHTGPTVNSYWAAISGNNTLPTCNFDVYGGSYSSGHALNEDASKRTKENSVVFLPAKGTINIEGGTFKAAHADAAVICVPYQNVGLNLNVSGGTFDASSGDAILRTYAPMTPMTTDTAANKLSITGGTFKGKVTNFISNETTKNEYSAFISGGTFSKEPASGLLAAGYTVNNVNGAYTVAKTGHVHKYSYVDTKAATCTEAGVRTYTCEGDQNDSSSKGCGTSYTEAIKALGHAYTAGTITWTDNGTSAATAKFTCSRDAKHTETVNATITKSLTKKSTCTEKGTNTYTATAKSSTGTTITATKMAQDEPELGHSYGPYTVTTQPTTSATGVATAKCTHEGCTSTITKTVAKLDSDEKTTAGGTSVTVKVDDAKPVTTPNGTQAVGSVTLEEVSSTATKVTIPETVAINGAEYAVEAIDAKAFAGNTAVTSVTVPDTVKTIAEGQFKDCSKLTSVTLPSAITEIPANAFAGTALTSVSIPSKVTSIGESAFQGTKLTSVDVPASVTTVGASAFAGTTALKSVTLPASVKTIGESAFAGSAVEEVKLPAAVTAVAADTFKDCTALKSVEAAKATAIGAEAFKGCSALTSVKIDSATSIGANAFAGTSALKSVTLPATVASVGASAFAGSGIEKIALPAAVTSVESDTFKGCTALTTIDAPAVETIGEGALSGCTALKTLSVESVKTIGTGALSGCTALATVKAPAAKTVAANAFKNCIALKTVSAPKVTSIASNAFKGCTALKTVTASKVKTIAANALVGCTALKKLTTGTALKSIGKNAFKSDSSLKTLTITSKKLSKKAVKGCLKGSSVTTIKVKVSGSAKAKAKYLAAYKKAFAKSNSGKKVNVL